MRRRLAGSSPWARCRRHGYRPTSARTNQRIDGKRLWDSLMGFAEIGATAQRRRAAPDPDRRGQTRRATGSARSARRWA